MAKLAIGLSATLATGFYYLAAAPPATAVDVCGPGNFSSACAPRSAQTADTEPSPSPSPSPAPAPAPAPFNIYTNPSARSSTSIPEPGTAIALLLTGAGIVCSVKKRNKQVGQ